MILNLLFNDFATEKKYLELQNKFESNNVPRTGFNDDTFTKIVKEDFSITLQISDESNSDNYKVFSFYSDFLYPKINDLAKETIEKIKQRIDNEFRYNEIERNSFLKITINDFLVINQNIIEADYLLTDVKDNLNIQINIVLEFLKDYDFGDNNNIIDKFQSKLNRADLLLLLHLFREKGILNHPVDSQFGYLIEKNFQCFNSKTKTYVNILKASKTVNELKNSGRTSEKSIKRLKELLQSDSFFELE